MKTFVIASALILGGVAVRAVETNLFYVTDEGHRFNPAGKHIPNPADIKTVKSAKVRIRIQGAPSNQAFD
jgi:hypothetical protein